MFSNLSKKNHQNSNVFNIRFVVVIHTNTEFFTLNSVLIGENAERREIVFQRIFAVLKEGVCFGRIFSSDLIWRSKSEEVNVMIVLLLCMEKKLV